MTAAPPQPARAEFTDIRLVAAAGEAARAERYEMLSKSTTCGAVSLPSPACTPVMWRGRMLGISAQPISAQQLASTQLARIAQQRSCA